MLAMRLGRTPDTKPLGPGETDIKVPPRGHLAPFNSFHRRAAAGPRDAEQPPLDPKKVN
jgi:hypothetical protein